MQRRAAAGYVLLFLVLAAGAYAMVAATSAPPVTVENPDYDLAAGDELTVQGRTYTVESVSAEEQEGDGHGGGGGVTYAATLAWTNDSARYTAEWDADDEVAFAAVDFLGTRLNGSYTVLVPNVTGDPTEATLREAPEDLETREIDGVTYVETRAANGSLQLTPIDQYEPLQRVTVTEGSVDYLGNETEVTVTNESVRLAWTAPRSETVDLAQAQNTTLNGQRLFVYFPSGDRVYLTQDTSSYRESVQANDRYNERRNGLWGITLLGGVTAVLLTALAFLPRKDV